VAPSDIATAAGQLGRRADTQIAVDALKRVNPKLLDLAYARRALSYWLWEEDYVELRIDGLRKAIALLVAEPEPGSDR